MRSTCAKFVAGVIGLAMVSGMGAPSTQPARVSLAANPATTTRPFDPADKTIFPGGVWLDDRGEHIQAHGGGIVKLDDTWYWFGEDRSKDLGWNPRGVACYSSTDLVNWTFRNRVFVMSDTPLPPEHPEFKRATTRPTNLMRKGVVLERPKVYHNKKTGKFVMYFHLDSGDYWAAEVGVAVSDTVDGDYKFVSHFRPFGLESRDIGQFIDDDGTPYLIFEDRRNGFHIASLSDDYLTVKEIVHTFRGARIEGGAVVKFDGLYYVLGSHLTGWDPNPNKYATAVSLSGPWSEFKDIAPPEVRTYGSQSTNLIKVVGTEGTTVIFAGDIWRPWAQYDSRYLWMPVEIGGGRMRLPQPRAWTMDVKTGKASVHAEAAPMALPPRPLRQPRPSTRPASRPATLPATPAGG